MSRQVKDLVVEEIRSKYGALDSAAVVGIIGLDAVTNNRLRGRLRKKNIELHVVKNSLARVALRDRPLSPLARALDGPSAIVTGGESIIDLARELLAITRDREFAKLELRFGVIEGEPEVLPIDRIARLKGRREMQADVAACVVSPGRKIAGCLKGPAARLAGCLQAIVDKAEKAGAAEPVAATA